MGIKETPTNFRVYYTCMKEYYNKQKDEANHAIDALTSEIARQKTDILVKEQAYKKEYDIVLSNYQEFIMNILTVYSSKMLKIILLKAIILSKTFGICMN